MIHQMQKLHGKRDDDETFKAIAGSDILFQRNSKRMEIGHKPRQLPIDGCLLYKICLLCYSMWGCHSVLLIIIISTGATHANIERCWGRDQNSSRDWVMIIWKTYYGINEFQHFGGIVPLTRAAQTHALSQAFFSSVYSQFWTFTSLDIWYST